MDGTHYHVHADSGYSRQHFVDVLFQKTNVSPEAFEVNIYLAADCATLELLY